MIMEALGVVWWRWLLGAVETGRMNFFSFFFYEILFHYFLDSIPHVAPNSFLVFYLNISCRSFYLAMFFSTPLVLVLF